MGAGDEDVDRGQIDLGMGHVHHQDLQLEPLQGRQATLDFLPQVGMGQTGQAGQRPQGAGGHEVGRFLQSLVFGQRGAVAGAPVKIPRQLGHFRQSPVQGFLRVGGGARGKDDFALLRKGGGVVGQGRHCGDAGI